jgi:Transmembrane protein of unknown function (DUF3556)
MGIIKPDLPDIDHATWVTLPRSCRLQVLTRHWVEHGFGTPLVVYVLYLLKITAYLVGAAAVISLTPGLGGLADIASWWSQPIVYQKLIVFTLLFEVLGLGCASGPLTLRFIPPFGGFLYWLRPGTIRLPPWPNRVPLTAGDTRTVVDVGLFVVVVVSAVVALLSPGHNGPVTDTGDVGLLNPVLAAPLIAALALLGLRDKTVFLAARPEHFGLALFTFFFPFADQIAAWKIILLALWWGAATSKLGHHFPYVVAVMMSNSPLLRSKWFKRKLYRDPVHDLRPSWLPKFLAHVCGTAVEYLVPLYLVFFAPDSGPWLWIAIGFMAAFHLNIISMVPMGVPLEWNVFMIFSLFFLYGKYGSIRVTDLNSPVLLAVLIASAFVVPVIGNLFPDKVSFLPAMRYYAGNWSTSAWCLRPGAEEKIETNVTKSSPLGQRQLDRLYDAKTAEMTLDKMPAWRSLHCHGRALNGLTPRAVGDEADYIIRDGEYIAGPVLGWNFAEGHLHNEQLVAALQRRCNFAEGEVRVVILESQPIHQARQYYRIVDAKTGLIEQGYVDVPALLSRQPWPEEHEELPVHVTTKHQASSAIR